MTIMDQATAVIAVGQLVETYVLTVLADPAVEVALVEATAEVAVVDQSEQGHF